MTKDNHSPIERKAAYSKAEQILVAEGKLEGTLHAIDGYSERAIDQNTNFRANQIAAEAQNILSNPQLLNEAINEYKTTPQYLAEMEAITDTFSVGKNPSGRNRTGS